MHKKQVLSLVVLILVTAGVTAAAIYQYKHSQNVTNAAVVKAQKERDMARSDAVTANFNLKAETAQVKSVTAQKVAACNALTAHKLSDPACVTSKE